MADAEFDISSAYDAIDDGADVIETPAVAETPAEPLAEDVAADMGDDFDAIEEAERTRDEKGRFVKKDEPETPAEPAIDAEVEAPVVNEAPAQLPKEIRDVWDKAPPEMQAWIEKREAETHHLATRVDGERQRGRSFDQLVAPYQDMIASEGGNPLGAAAELFNTAQMLRNPDPAARAQVLNLIAARFNIDIEQAYYSRPDPQVAQRDLQLMHTNAQLANYQAAEQAQIVAQLQAQVASFRAADHPYFEELAPQMAELFEKGVCNDLQTAYNFAIGSNESLRSTLIEQTVQDRLAAEEATRTAQVAKARRAAISPTSAPGTAKPPGSSPKLSPEEHIALDYDRVMAELE